MEADVYIGEDAGAIARRKAKYGHRDWLTWRNRNNQLCAALCSADTLKRAMLDTGTQGNFTRIGGDGIGLMGSWRLGALWLRMAKKGYY